MNQESQPIASIKARTETLGDKVRKIADQIKEESDLQVKVTSRILGAAAQIAENHDQLIVEVTDMVEEDLDQKNSIDSIKVYDVDNLKQEFRTLKEAKSHFGLKANSWASLADKINNDSTQNPEFANKSIVSTSERFDSLENKIEHLSSDVGQILILMQKLIAAINE